MIDHNNEFDRQHREISHAPMTSSIRNVWLSGLWNGFLYPATESMIQWLRKEKDREAKRDDDIDFEADKPLNR
jgi:hypothetical protein